MPSHLGAYEVASGTVPAHHTLLANLLVQRELLQEEIDKKVTKLNKLWRRNIVLQDTLDKYFISLSKVELNLLEFEQKIDFCLRHHEPQCQCYDNFGFQLLL